MKAIKVIIGIIFVAFGCARTAIGAGIILTASETSGSSVEALAFGLISLVIATLVFSNAFKGQG